MSVVGRTLRLLAYSHDGYGLGHLRRNLRVIGGLLARRSNVSVLAVTGCKLAHEFRYPPGVDYLKLPAVTKVSNDCYVADGLDISREDVTRLRARTISEAVDRFEPDLVLVDRHPLGLNDELVPGLRTLRARRPSARLVLGLRDIIDEPTTVCAEWARTGHDATIERLYDSVMVYGSRGVYDLISAYRLTSGVAAKVRFVGYLAHEAPVVPAQQIHGELDLREDTRLALCTLGGGKDAVHVASAFLGAMRLLGDRCWQGLLVTGPYMSHDDCQQLAESASGIEAVAMRRFVPDLPSHLAAADAVLCMGGYNTLCEALSVGAAAVVVPRVRPRLEQCIRARAFAARGLVRVVHPDALAPELVARELQDASDDDCHRRTQAFETLGRRGVEHAAAHLDRMLGERRTPPAPRQLVPEPALGR
jgi:predicted glycosyltransferase